MIVFYCVGTTFEEGTHTYTTDAALIKAENQAAQEKMWTHYPMWQDIHVMVFIGFGFLMVFLKTHSWASVGFNYIIAAWAIQCTIVFQGFWHQVILKGKVSHKINLDMIWLIFGDFGAATTLITMGAVLGKTSFPQLFALITFECIFLTLNVVIIVDLLGAVDLGGSIPIHMFGAYYGLAASFFFKPKKAIEDRLQ